MAESGETIKIAFGSDDGEQLANRFGTARKAVVVTLREAAEVSREVRDKVYNEMHHHHHDEDADHDHEHDVPDDKFAAVTDCQVVVTRSIGPHGAAYAAAQGMTLYTVREKTVDEALAHYLAGTLTHEPRRIT